MAKVEEKTKFCQSKFYKDWNPDTLAKYNRYVLNPNYNGGGREGRGQSTPFQGRMF